MKSQYIKLSYMWFLLLTGKKYKNIFKKMTSNNNAPGHYLVLQQTGRTCENDRLIYSFLRKYREVNGSVLPFSLKWQSHFTLAHNNTAHAETMYATYALLYLCG